MAAEPSLAPRETDPDPAPRSTAPVYFPELDGLRTIAFLSVYIFHGADVQSVIAQTFEQLAAFLSVHILRRADDHNVFAQTIGKSVARTFELNGWVGVQLFFILSGFLIATLLLNEEARFGRIDLRAFWIRRACRIWPLYYLCVLIGFLVMPWVDGKLRSPEVAGTVSNHLLAFLGFAGNWSLALRGPPMNFEIGILWSVCVEEQFYLVVPLLIAWVPARFRIRVVIALMAAAIALRWRLGEPGQSNQMLIQFNTFAQFDTLLSGVLLALVLGKDPKASRVGHWARWLQWPLFALIIWGLSGRQLGQVGQGLGQAGRELAWNPAWDFVAIWACGVGLVTVAVAVRGWLQRFLSSTILVWLGKISYGLYMYHEVAFWLKPKVTSNLGWFPNRAVLVVIGTFATTVALAALSYYLYERPFLKLKKAWTRLPTRPV